MRNGVHYDRAASGWDGFAAKVVALDSLVEAGTLHDDVSACCCWRGWMLQSDNT